MTKQRVVIQDLNKADMPTVTEMVGVSHIESVSGDILRFVYDDYNVTIINIAPGWNVSITVDEDD